MAYLNFKEILELIDKVSEKELGSVEIESAGLRLKIEGKRSAAIPSYESHPIHPQHPLLPSAVHAPLPAPQNQSAVTAAPPADEIDASWHILTSPIVGTFYRAPNPEAESFVNVGDRVSKGNVLCIIEAMKLMNEIESEVDGVVMRVFPQNGQPVEFGEKLFAIKV